MTRAWENAVSSLYADVDAAPTGAPGRQELRDLHAAGETNTLRVIALLTACRVVVYPQLPLDAVPAAAAALRALLARLAGGLGEPISEVAALVGRVRVAAGTNPEEVALRCVAMTVDYVINPSPDRFVALVQTMIAAQRNEQPQPDAARQQMIGWMDDVVSRDAKFGLPDALNLAVAALEGTIPGLGNAWYPEGVGDDDGSLQVFAADVATGDLTSPLINIEEPELVGRELRVHVTASPGEARDRFRIGYLFEHYIHRVFLDGDFAIQYDQIAYRCDSTGDCWQVPA